MDLNLTWRLAHQLDWETFSEIHEILESHTGFAVDDNLLDVLEKKRILMGLNYEDFAQKFQVTKQAYGTWRRLGRVPIQHLAMASELLNVSPKEVSQLNFVKKYEPRAKSIIQLIENKRKMMGIGKKELAKLLGISTTTYLNWRKNNSVPDRKLNTISKTLGIPIETLVAQSNKEG